MTERNGWWYRATTKQRIEQIEGAIDAGLTYIECALFVRCDRPSTVLSFARYYGLKFCGDRDVQKRRVAKKNRLHQVRRHSQMRGNIPQEAFDIFGVKSERENLFDEADA